MVHLFLLASIDNKANCFFKAAKTGRYIKPLKTQTAALSCILDDSPARLKFLTNYNGDIFLPIEELVLHGDGKLLAHLLHFRSESFILPLKFVNETV